LENITGDPFGAGIVLKLRLVIEVGVIQAGDKFPEFLFEYPKINEHSPLVQLRAPNPDPDPVVMAVEVFAFTVIVA
jgi:hypothetical protein